MLDGFFICFFEDVMDWGFDLVRSVQVYVRVIIYYFDFQWGMQVMFFWQLMDWDNWFINLWEKFMKFVSECGWNYFNFWFVNEEDIF